MKWQDTRQKECGHEAMYTDESFTCSKRSCPYPYQSDGTVWNKRDADDMEYWIENLGQNDKVKEAIKQNQTKGQKELLIQILSTENLGRVKR